MLNKLKKILQWFVSVCFILSGLIYVGEYKELIESTLKSSSNYANTDSSNKKAFKKIAADKDSIATFTMAWRQYLKTHMNNARVNHSKSSFDIWDGFRPIRQVWFSLSRASGHFVSCFVSGKKVQ